jgi:hypothetical protein
MTSLILTALSGGLLMIVRNPLLSLNTLKIVRVKQKNNQTFLEALAVFRFRINQNTVLLKAVQEVKVKMNSRSPLN